MTCSIAYLGPEGTYTEMAAQTYLAWLYEQTQQPLQLKPYPSIAQVLQATVKQETQLSLVPVENSVEGGVTVTLDTLWELDSLRIQHALVIPIRHALLSTALSLPDLKKIYSHPQALAQCQRWLGKNLPQVQLIPTPSTTEALTHLHEQKEAGAIASKRASQLYQLPTLAYPINDHSDNCTKFWAIGLSQNLSGEHTFVAFTLPVNAPGALLKPLQIFAKYQINLSRIESRPTKRSLGDYLFFVDLETAPTTDKTQSALTELKTCTEHLKNFGSYTLLPVNSYFDET